jgi:macrodomain Ter protein organizer (MatP/YcbG family)
LAATTASFAAKKAAILHGNENWSQHSVGETMSAELWELLKQELRKEADREMAATQNQSRKDSIRGDLTRFVRLPVPNSDDEMSRRRAMAAEYRTAWANTGKDGRLRDALFGRRDEPEKRDRRS